MRIDWLKTSRLMAMASLFALAVAPAGCATESASGDEAAQGGDEEAATVDDITSVDHSKVKRQSIGNCWFYATTSWVEALNKGTFTANEPELNLSESYGTYWHWFEQIGNRGGTEISTGGSWGTAVGLIERYGMMPEGAFIPEESEAEMSGRQASALAAVNKELKEGVLKDPAARRDRKKVREVLDKAWGLNDSVKATLNTVFGAGVERTLDRAYRSRKPAGGILRPRDIAVRLKNPTTGQFEKGTLQDAIGTGSTWSRSGKYAWNEVDFPFQASQRRAFYTRIQKALHDRQPVVVSWKVDFNALTAQSVFDLAALETKGPGRQGGHMTVMHDYQAKLGDGRVLKAGEQASAEDLARALDPSTRIEFIRVKNSWGASRPDRWSFAALPGYHDLTTAYLEGPIWDCAEGVTDRNQCSKSAVPLWDVVLPPGY
jgi:hypothetical protein